MLGKLLLFAVIALLVYWALKVFRREVKRRHESQGESPPAAGEDMVRCAHCSVHLPKSESITTQGKFFCSDQHRRLHLDS